MLSIARAFQALDSADIRLNPPTSTYRSEADILKQRKIIVETILRITNDDEDNPIRQKGAEIIRVIEARRKELRDEQPMGAGDLRPR